MSVLPDAHFTDPIIVEHVQVQSVAVPCGTGGVLAVRTLVRIASFFNILRVLHNQFLYSETDSTKLHNVSLCHLDRAAIVLEWVTSILDFFHRCQLFGLLVLETYNLPCLLEMAVLIIKLAIGLIERFGVVNPVRTTFVNDR